MSSSDSESERARLAEAAMGATASLRVEHLAMEKKRKSDFHPQRELERKLARHLDDTLDYCDVPSATSAAETSYHDPSCRLLTSSRFPLQTEETWTAAVPSRKRYKQSQTKTSCKDSDSDSDETDKLASVVVSGADILKGSSIVKRQKHSERQPKNKQSKRTKPPSNVTPTSTQTNSR
ncbi:uncharacterized protein [Oscarella lobularis]|uniref:uncharacterized protein n=1 Tax=Oscarella lobularis TaxID=121494 RepID=UPI0033130FD2